MSKIQQPWGAVKLGPVLNFVVIGLLLPVIFVVATIGSAIAMVVKSK